MKWFRVLFAVMALSMATCSNPTAPRYPEPDDPSDPGPTEPGPNSGFYFAPGVEVTFLV